LIDERLRKRENTSDDQIEEILEMKKQNLSNVQIAAALGVSETAIRRRLKKNVGRLDAEL
jgi:DNA-binding Lrp family transcriptional regulator